MIVNDRITAYIQSLDAGNGPLLDSIEEEALADCVPIIRRETSAFLKTLIALKRPQSILEVGTAVGYSALLSLLSSSGLAAEAAASSISFSISREVWAVLN